MQQRLTRVLPPLALIGTLLGCLHRGPRSAVTQESSTAIYQIRIDENAKHILHVEADVPINEPLLSIGWWRGTPKGKRWRDQIDDLTITDPDGESVEWVKSDAIWSTGAKLEQWSLSGDLPDWIHLSYRVRLEHDEYQWPPHGAEASLVREQSVFFRNWVALVVPPEVRKGIIRFDLPDGWRVTTPLASVADHPLEFVAETRYELLNAGMMVGTHQTRRAAVGRITLDVGVAHDLPDAIDHMVGPFTEALEEARNIFGGTPGGRYAIVATRPSSWQSGMGGSGMGNGMVVLLQTHPRDDVGGMWAFVLIHELLHMWLGNTIRDPDTPKEQWFGEGMSDYLTMMIGGRRGLLRPAVQLSYMGQMWDKYQAQVGDRAMTIAGREKSRFYNLIYGGGMWVGVLLDIELRRATSGEQTIDHLMRELNARFGVTQRRMTSHDVEAVASEIAGRNLGWIFERFVRGIEPLSPELVHAPLGLTLSGEVGQGRRLAVDPAASAAARQLRAAILGID